MANRYWVGGGSSTSWVATGNTNWATSSGGANNASVPTSSDDVFFDASSGSGTVVGGASSRCLSLTATNFTGTLKEAVDIYGNLTLGSGLTTSVFQPSFKATSTGWTITSAGKTCYSIVFNGAGGGWTLNDALTVGASAFFMGAGTFNSGDQTITMSGGWSSNIYSGTKVMNLGSSTINHNSAALGINFGSQSGGSLTLNAGTSTINFNPTSSSISFIGWDKPFYNVEINSSTTIDGSNTFNDLKIGAGATATFIAGTTQTVTTFTSGGVKGSLATIKSDSAGSAFTLSDSSGTNSVNYMSIKDSTVTGGATWEAVDSTNVSGNTGWVFSYTNTGAFLQFM